MSSSSMKTLALLSLLSAGCNFPLPAGDPDGGAHPVAATQYVPREDGGTSIVSGYVWDPEAYWLSVASCGQTCPIPPLVFPGIPHLEAALIRGGQVSLFDPLTNMPAASGTTSAQGTFNLKGVPSRSTVPFFPLTMAAPQPTPADGGTTVAYLPTLSLRPVATGWGQCMAVSALQASTVGILDAVARYESAPGPVVKPSDLVNPQKYGGVGIFWAFQPGPSALRVPAFGTSLTASGGRVLHIDWAPPGALPPPADAFQSPRGFFVGQSPVSALGINVVLLPPLTGAPTPVAISFVDGVQDPAQGRPWAFPPLPPLVLAPGVITYGEIPGLLPGSASGEIPAWVCLPSGS